MGTLVSVPCLILVILGPPFFTYLVSKNKNEILEEDENFLREYGTLIEDLRVSEGWVQRHYKVLQLYKMLAVVLILIFLRYLPLIQVLLLILLQLANEIVLLLFKPLETPNDNRLEFITEFLTKIYLLFYLILTDLVAVDVQDS